MATAERVDAQRAGRAGTLSLRSGAWYGDAAFALEIPGDWDVQVHRPRTPPPLDDAAIAAALASPIGQPPLRELARGHARATILVDDLTRPTPVDRVIPFVLASLAEAGVPASGVTVLVATGTHAAPSADALARKLGRAAMSTCRVVVHDDRGPVVRAGRTRAGTPVWLDREAARGGLLVGIGGVYPQHTAGFGGGSKLALGVLGRRSIAHLHLGHAGVDGSYEVDNDFRRDLDEIAEGIGLRTIVSLHVDGDREIVRVVSGDWRAHYADSARFSREAYEAPAPGDADVVIANAYPMDVSLTFMRSKGMIPLFQARPEASRVVLAACPEGVGHHGLYPFAVVPRFHGQEMLARRLQVMGARGVARAVVRRIGALVTRPAHPVATPRGRGFAHRAWLFRPLSSSAPPLPERIPGMREATSWPHLLAAVAAEQAPRRRLRAVVYACAPLQCLVDPAPPA